MAAYGGHGCSIYPAYKNKTNIKNFGFPLYISASTGWQNKDVFVNLKTLYL